MSRRDSVYSDLLSIVKINKKNTRKILVVDDQAINFEIIEGFLMILGFQNIKENVVFANNG